MHLVSVVISHAAKAVMVVGFSWSYMRLGARHANCDTYCRSPRCRVSMQMSIVSV